MVRARWPMPTMAMWAQPDVSLYRGKVCVEKNIPEEEAVERLLQLIREDGEA